jgi:hypothetical protein
MTPEMHRMIYRGRCLGTKPTDEQYAHIKDGTFEDLWLGDYWTSEGFDWIVADANYLLNCGDTPLTKQHLMIIPAIALYKAQMNSSAVTTGAYIGSDMRTTNLEKAKTIAYKVFGDRILTYREYLANAVSNGKPSAGAWYDATVELPNECMIYGHNQMSPSSDGSTLPSIYTVSKTQLALFAVCPRLIPDRDNGMWLRDVVSSSRFACVTTNGGADYGAASLSLGVRPVFAIG